jgi:peptidoglycan/xylan/chitin deacetylase (PgdA/CDA1 family)
MYAKRLPPRAVTLTFDDGTCDFALRAMPLLATHQAPATVYLTTYHVRSQFPIFGPMSSYLLWKSPGRTFTLPDSKRRVIAPDKHDRPARDALQKHMADSARDLGLSAAEKHAWLEDLAKELGIDLDALVARRLFHIMSPAELTSLDRSLVDLQLHTHRHLMPDDPAKFRREIDDNRAAMADFVGDTPLRHFCYPSGEYLPQHLPWLEDAGVVSATTCNPGLAGPTDRRLLLPRLLDSERITDAKFAAWAHGPGPIVRLIAGSSLG